MTKRTIVATLGKTIGEIMVEGTAYPLLSPNGLVVQEIEAAEGGEVKISDAYRLVGRCAPAMPKEILDQIAVEDIVRILEEIKGAITASTAEALAGGPKAETATTP